MANEDSMDMQNRGALAPDPQLQAGVAPGNDAADEFAQFIQGLPPGMRDNLRNIIDVANLTPEQLRGLVSGGEATDRMTELAFTPRGSTQESPLDWVSRANTQTPEQAEVSEAQLGQMQPSPTPSRSAGAALGPGRS